MRRDRVAGSVGFALLAGIGIAALPRLGGEDRAPGSPPPAIEADGVPAIPKEIIDTLARYQEIRSARFLDWDPRGPGILVARLSGNLRQLHAVAEPGAKPVPITSGDEPVSSGRFLPGGAVIFSRAQGGDENYQIHRLLPGNGAELRLTDGRSRNLLQEIHPDGRRVAFSSTMRNGRDADIYIIDTEKRGDPERLLEVDRETWSLADWSPDGARAVIVRYISRSESYAEIIDIETRRRTGIPAELPALASPQRAQGVSRSAYRFGPEGKCIWFLTDARGEFLEPARLDLEKGATDFPAGDLGGDADDLELSPDRERAALTVNAGGYSELHLLEGLGTPAPRRRRIDLPRCLVSGPRFSPDGRRLGLTLGRPDEPEEAYALDVESGELTRWTSSERAGFEAGDFVAPHSFRYASFDGREIPAFLFRPRLRDGEPRGKFPVIISIHGGPESQFRPWFSESIQHSVRELGAAVIAPNVRGSTGYGKSYSRLDDGNKREDSVRDIGSLLDWIAGAGARDFGLDPKRVAVIGGSYGGYMTLASLIHLGERLRAGIDLVGITDFITFLENTSAYRRDLRRAEYGDERDPEMRRFFEAISPLRRIGALRSALLLVHGKNDPRVPFSETLQVVEKARAAGNPVWTVYAANEGHGFSRRENRDWQQAASVLFLRTFLLAPSEASGAAARRRLGESLGSASGRGESLELDLGGERTVDHVLATARPGGGSIPRRYAVEALLGGRWRPVAAGGVLDGARVHSLEPLRAARLRLRVLEAEGGAGAAPAALELAAFSAVPEAARAAYAAAREKASRRAPPAEAIADLDRAVEAYPEFPPFHLQRARLLEEEGRLEEARRDLDRALSADSSLAGARHQRANVLFKLGLFAAAVSDYDAAAAGGGPHDDDSCWERGLAWYYLGEYEKGRRQFEGYHRADHLDIENGIWRYLTIAEKEGLDRAIETFLPYPERVRPPFPALHDLFAGKGSPEAVLRQAEEAARSEDDRRTNLFYGHYYIAKYHEVRRERERAIAHLREALERRIPHFMYDCARIDLGRLEAAKGN